MCHTELEYLIIWRILPNMQTSLSTSHDLKRFLGQWQPVMFLRQSMTTSRLREWMTQGKLPMEVIIWKCDRELSELSQTGFAAILRQLRSAGRGGGTEYIRHQFHQSAAFLNLLCSWCRCGVDFYLGCEVLMKGLFGVSFSCLRLVQFYQEPCCQWEQLPSTHFRFWTSSNSMQAMLA